MPVIPATKSDILRRSAIGERGRARRVELGLTQEDIAQRLATTRAWVSQLEREGTQHLDIVWRWARALETHPALLLFGDEDDVWHGLSV